MTSAYETPVLVVDLEATCWERRIASSGERQSTHNMEIVEFGCALANQACRHGLSVRYFQTSRLLKSLSIAHGDGRFAKLTQPLAKMNLLVLDDWGLEKMTLSQRNDLLEIMEDRHGQRSTLITSQLPITPSDRLNR
jgi:DNA replication protein DnaC